MRKAGWVSAVLMIVLLIVPLALDLKVVNANPFWIFHQIEPRPDAIPPKTTIFSPQNNSQFSSDNITISFYVDRPKLDMNGSIIDIQDSSIINITYTLDDKTMQAFTIWKNGSAGSDSGIPNFNTSLNSPKLSTGNHFLTVYAEAVVFAGGLDIFFMNSSTTVFFSTGIQPPLPTPIPSLPEFSWLVVVPLFVFTLVGVVAVRYRFNNKKRHQIA
jgi:hypothetical protein